jgi:tRNA(Ile)-lysidine synthase
VRDAARRTLVACSGGADSAALAIALAGRSGGARASIVLAHIVHDLRPEREALADRDRTRALAAMLGVECVEGVARVRSLKGNAEANARRSRYAALAALAIEHQCQFVATGHQGNDQLETLLMRLLRGSGLRGLRAIRASRGIGRGVVLVRPMLGVTREDAERLCAIATYEPAIDATNADVSRLRSALRHEVVPILARMNPGVYAHATDAAALIDEAQRVVSRRARALARRGMIPLADLKRAGPLVAGEAVLLAAQRAAKNRELTLPRRTLSAILKAIETDAPRTRTFRHAGLCGRLTPRGFAWEVDSGAR